MKLPHVKKSLARKHFFQTPFSHSILKLVEKNYTEKARAFSLHFSVGVTKITAAIWLQK